MHANYIVDIQLVIFGSLSESKLLTIIPKSIMLHVSQFNLIYGYLVHCAHMQFYFELSYLSVWLGGS